MTNFEKIKQMSVKEFAKYFAFSFPCSLCEIKNPRIPCDGVCKEQCAKWLESEVKEQKQRSRRMSKSIIEWHKFFLKKINKEA